MQQHYREALIHDLMYFRVLIYIITLVWLLKYSLAEELPEYHVYKQQQQEVLLSNQSLTSENSTQPFVIGGLLFETTITALMEKPNVEFPPAPCESAQHQDFQTRIYCFGLLALWFMLMLSALVYQIRSLPTFRTLLMRFRGQ